MIKYIAIVWALLSLPLSDHNSDSKSVSISLVNQKFSSGNIYLAVYDSEKSFGKPEKAVFQKIYPSKIPFNTSLELKKGIYSVAVFQDLNANGKLDYNWTGIPSEPYGFSANPKIMFGPPSFDECKIDIEKTSNIQIRLR